MKVSLGSDHGGYKVKEVVKKYLQQENISIIDRGINYLQPKKIFSVNYPIFGKVVAKDISRGKADFGILVCTTGVGMSIVANRFSRVRAALCKNLYITEMSRKHNNANILCLSSDLKKENILKIVNCFLKTPFEGERHQKRIDMFDLLGE